jgi:hypothetical protein
MKKIIPALILLFCLFSCSKAPQPLSKEEIKRKSDSLSNVRIRESNEHARQDLDHRIKIEVKVMADSLLNKRLQKANSDSLAKKNKEKAPVAIPSSPQVNMEKI